MRNRTDRTDRPNTTPQACRQALGRLALRLAEVRARLDAGALSDLDASRALMRLTDADRIVAELLALLD